MQVTVQDGVTIVRLDSSYSAFNEPHLDELQDQLLTIVKETPSIYLVLDFEETEFFGSVFFEILFRAWKRIRERRGRFALCQLRPACQEILETAKLDTLWDIYPDLDSALSTIEPVAT